MLFHFTARYLSRQDCLPGLLFTSGNQAASDSRRIVFGASKSESFSRSPDRPMNSALLNSRAGN